MGSGQLREISARFELIENMLGCGLHAVLHLRGRRGRSRWPAKLDMPGAELRDTRIEDLDYSHGRDRTMDMSDGRIAGLGVEERCIVFQFAHRDHMRRLVRLIAVVLRE